MSAASYPTSIVQEQACLLEPNPGSRQATLPLPQLARLGAPGRVGGAAGEGPLRRRRHPLVARGEQ
jgi:hypothetical protein